MTDCRYEGGCTCGQVRYQMNRRPMFIHCCHCTWCQRESGSAFALNGMVESSEISLIHGTVEEVNTPTLSGKGQLICRCPNCRVALWSYYGAAKELVAFVRIGTLDEARDFPPDIHIFTSSAQPWLNLAGDIPAVEEFYRRSEYWPQNSIERYKTALADA